MITSGRSTTRQLDRARCNWGSSSTSALLCCKQKVRELTRRTRGISLEQMAKELAAYLKGLEELLRLLSDPFAAQGSGSMDTASAAIHDLEAVETRNNSVREATSAWCRPGRLGGERVTAPPMPIVNVGCGAYPPNIG